MQTFDFYIMLIDHEALSVQMDYKVIHGCPRGPFCIMDSIRI